MAEKVDYTWTLIIPTTWTLIIPISKLTYAFKVALDRCKWQGKTFIKPHKNKDVAAAFIAELEAKGTGFTVVYLTDKQFGEIKIVYPPLPKK